jgi:hypothetical protein
MAIGIDNILFERGAKIKVIPAIIRRDTSEEPAGTAHFTSFWRYLACSPLQSFSFP